MIGVEVEDGGDVLAFADFFVDARGRDAGVARVDVFGDDVVVLDAESAIFEQEQTAAGYSVSVRPHALAALS